MTSGAVMIENLGAARVWISLFAAIGTLSLAVIIAFRGGAATKSPLGRTLAGLCFVLFGWNFSVLAVHVSRSRGLPSVFAFGQLDALFTALSPPFVFEVVLSFVGEQRRRRVVRAASWTWFGVLALVPIGGFVSPKMARWGDEIAWATTFLAGWVAMFGYGVFVLVRHLTRNGDAREKARARVVLAALAIGGACSTSDAGRGLGLPLPYLGAAGTLVAAALLATLVVRLELLDRSVSARTAIYAVAMIVAFAVVLLVVLVAFAGKLAAQLFAVSVLALLVAVSARELALSVAEARARTLRLATLGRFSAQMAHDIRGPLTALLGAVDVLDGSSDEETRRELHGLVTDQAKRVAAVVDRYDRMARIEPQRTIVRANDVVRDVARAHGVAPANLVLAAGDPECDADQTLVESAVENVLRNAIEATKNPSLVRVTTTADAGASKLVIRVIDDGPGMDVRVLERAAEDFFTTKPDGSGLGLAFARRVLEAHAGTLTIRSELGRGTTVELTLPLERSEPRSQRGTPRVTPPTSVG